MTRVALVLFSACLLLSSSAFAQETPTVDFDEDGEVGFSDFIIFARGFGKTDQDAGFDARLDLDGNGEVDFQDFILFARGFGVPEPPADDSDREPFDPRRIYVADFFGDRVFVLDGDTNMFNPGLSVTVRQPRSVIYSFLNRRFYVAAVDAFYALTESSEIEHELPLQVPSPTPEGSPSPLGGFRMALAPDHRLIYVGGEYARVVEVIQLRTMESIARIPLSLAPSGIAVSPDGGTLFVGHWNSSTITLVDGHEHTVSDSIQLDGRGNGRVVVSPQGDMAYTATTRGGSDPTVQIVSIDTETKAVVNMLEVAPDTTTIVYDIQASGDGQKLYATVRREFLSTTHPLGKSFTGYFWTIDRATFKKTNEIEVTGEATSFAISRDGNTAYAIVNQTPLLGQDFWIVVLDLDENVNLGGTHRFLFPTDIKAYGGKAALGRLMFPEITVF